MHVKKAEYFKRNYPEEDCVSGITTIPYNEMMVGTPCIINCMPFVNHNRSASYLGIAYGPTQYRQQPRHSDRPEEAPYAPLSQGRQRDRNREDRHRILLKKKSEPKKEPSTNRNEKIPLKQLYEIAKEKGIEEANEVIRRSLSKVNVLFLFSIWNDMRDYHLCAMSGKCSVYFDGSTPLIFDKYKRVELERLRDTHSLSDINNFPDLILEDLKEHRYVNYTFGGVSASNRTRMQEDINVMYDSLRKAFPFNTCFFRYASRGRKDVASISFYRLTDVMPIFDYKRAAGVGMEMFLTDSRLDSDAAMDHIHSATYRFLFARDKENIFTIDGEIIKRAHDKQSNKCMIEAQNILYQDASKDKKQRGQEDI